MKAILLTALLVTAAPFSKERLKKGKYINL